MAGSRLCRLLPFCVSKNSTSLRWTRACTTRLSASLGCGALALALSACGEADKPGRVAAEVNTDRISIHQVNSAIARSANATPQDMQRARRDALESLVDQQLAAQMAIKRGLEHDPEVLGRLEDARREVLARSYLNSVVSAQPAPTDEEVARYHDAHPLLYAQRRYYVLREIAMPAKDAPVGTLRALTANRSVEQIAAWLQASGKTISVSASTRPAEDIPGPVLEALAQLRRGTATVVDTPDGVFVVHLVSFRDAPLDAGTVNAQIRRTLVAERARTAVGRELERMREGSRIRYRNEFVHSESPAPAASTTPTAAPATLLVADPVAR